MRTQSLSFILWVFAFVCFTLAALVQPYVSSRINLVGAGLAFAALAHIVGGA